MRRNCSDKWLAVTFGAAAALDLVAGLLLLVAYITRDSNGNKNAGLGSLIGGILLLIAAVSFTVSAWLYGKRHFKRVSTLGDIGNAPGRNPNVAQVA